MRYAAEPLGGPDSSVEALVARSGDLKAELLEFAQGPRHQSQLEARLYEAAGRAGELDETTRIWTIDHFLLQHRLRGGRTVVERFVEQRRPRLGEDERAMLLGWPEVVEGCFEVQGHDGAAVELLNLVDDLRYTVHSNVGRAMTRRFRKGMFVIARIVPVHPNVDGWLFSGAQVPFAKSHGPRLARSAVQTVAGNPQLLGRNPDLLRRSWEAQAEDRADFVAHFGTDLVVLEPEAAQEQLRAHYRHRVDTARRRGADPAGPSGPSPDTLGQIPEDLLDAESIALVYDPVEGLNFYRDFGRLDALFADPSLARDSRYRAQLRRYLRDDSVSPLAIRRLVQRHPGAADPVFRTVLGKPEFCWDRDGEQMLRRRKKQYYDREPTPGVSVLGERLLELLKRA